MTECDWCEWQTSADLLQELHAVVGRHADTMELQQTEIYRLESEVADSLLSCATMQKERDDVVNEVKCLQQQSDQQIAQHKLEVWTASCHCKHLINEKSVNIVCQPYSE